MIYFVEALGIKAMQTKFERMVEARIDATPVMETLGTTMMGIIDRIFQSQGRRGGGSWKRDSPAWLARKVNEGLDPRINFATGDLHASMTDPEDPNQTLEVTPEFVSLGSALEYAARSNAERPFTKFTAGDRLLMRGMVRDYLMASWKHGRRPGVNL